MHEHKIAHEIIEKAKAEGKVTKITVSCGALAHLPAKDLENVLKDHADFEVEVIETPAKVKCECGFVGKPKIEMHSHDINVFFCPKCGNVPKVLEGEDIILKRVEVED
jgi:Zn finger protein HypA/HybF involved in hydrogenase expression